VRHDTGEHTGPAAPGRVRIDAGPFQDLPGDLPQQALLRVHRDCLARADPEERRVEVGGGVQEAALAHIAGAGPVRVGVVERVKIPAPVGREAGDGVAAGREQRPEILG